MPCHPADGLALAERAGAPIYATDEVLHYACPLVQSHQHDTGLPHVMHGPQRVGPEHFRVHWQGRN